MFLPTNSISSATPLLARDSSFNIAQSHLYTLPEGANTTQVAAAYAPEASKIQPNLAGSGHFTLYQDAFGATPAASDLQAQGYNVYAPAFWLSQSGPFDTLKAFCEAGDKQSVLDQYHAAGIKVVLTAFGSTDTPQDKYPNAADAANAIADYVQQCGLDGVDVDYEDFPRWNSGQGTQWIIDLTNSLRDRLPQGQYLLTHAPIGAWLARGLYQDGGYATINDKVGSKIDWYNVQYYNQHAENDPSNEAWVTKETLLNQASIYPGSAVQQVISDGFPAEKIIVGKGATPDDAPRGGYVAPGDLGSWLNGAQFGGISIWQAPHQADYLKTVRAAAGI